MKKIYFDVLCGASGDMILATLVDCGVPLKWLNEQLQKLCIEGLAVTGENQTRNGIRCFHIDVVCGPQKTYRHLSDIRDVIGRAGFSSAVFDRCNAVLTRLGTAEATVHDIPLEHVHFHEIGAVDTIVDILGTVLCLDYLSIDEVEFSTLTDGHGTVEMDHGRVPVPVPAVSVMVKGFSMKTLDVESELLTPTGCALLTGLGKQVAFRGNGTIVSMGHGCGTKVLHHHSNMLRGTLIESGSDTLSSDVVEVVETDIDHVSGEILASTCERLFAAQALDVSFAPIYMKKGRPAYRLSALCKPEHRQQIIDCIMLHTRTLGVRYYQAQRVCADRESLKADFMGTIVDEKQCSYKGHSFRKIEYDALNALSLQTGRPVIDLMDEYIRTQKKAH